jgi:hypothetical protein
VKRSTKIVMLLAVAALGAVQLVRVERTNRLGAGDPEASREVKWILRRACYDCHSTETRWPIWAYVAPMSWRVVADVERARQRVNFSDWAAYDRPHRMALRTLVGQVTARHQMPLWYYLTLHPDARLSHADMGALLAWSMAVAAEPP